MRLYSIAVLPGDGIGPEVVSEGVKVLKAALSLVSGVRFEFTTYEVGAGLYRRTGVALPDDVYEACRKADAIFFGACGLPDVRRPDGTEAGTEVQLELRFRLDLYAGIRPIKLYPGIDSPLRNASRIDYVIVRENTEGLYASRRGGVVLRNEVAVDSMIITRTGTSRVVKKAFQIAQERHGSPKDGISRVTCVDKSNVTIGYAFFRRVFDETAAAWPHIERDYAYIDAFTLYQVVSPSYYDVVVTENMFGDIISDLGAATIGGLGMAPTADVGDRYGLFQPAHGSAPGLTGKGIANPLAAILSGAMMLDWLGTRDKEDQLRRAARAIERAVEDLLAERVVRTPDIGGSASTTEVGDAVADRVSRMRLGELA